MNRAIHSLYTVFQSIAKLFVDSTFNERHFVLMTEIEVEWSTESVISFQHFSGSTYFSSMFDRYHCRM